MYICLNKHIKIVDIQIKKNDALTVLASSVKMSIKETETRILKFLRKHNEYISTETCGYSIVDLSETEEFNMTVMMNSCFVMDQNNTEVKELLDAIFIWGFGECPECGCKIQTESQGSEGLTWHDDSCLNSECDYKISGEPDWDSMPGGHDDY